MPGKFEGCENEQIGEYLHELTLDGTSETTGDVSENGHWYGLLRGLSEQDIAKAGLLPNTVGAIVTEDSQGFVEYETYTSEAELTEAWAKIEADVEEYYAEWEDEAEA